MPKGSVPDRYTLVRNIALGKKDSFAQLDGPGCIRHIWVTTKRSDMVSCRIVMRIYFDGEETPHVEAPLGDFFGVMHGQF